jgi:hypothetical protein
MCLLACKMVARIVGNESCRPKSGSSSVAERHLPLARLCPRRQAACHAPGCCGVPAPFSSSTFCPGVSCASATTTACCRTASANSCCPWRAYGSPLRAASRCLCRPCQVATSGTAHVAMHRCASSSASPPHHPILHASIPHDRLGQSALSACKHARLRRSVCPACKTASSARSTRSPNTSIADRSCHCSPPATIGDAASPQKHLPNHEIAFNIHNSPQHHRDRNASGFLLTSNRKRLG